MKHRMTHKNAYNLQSAKAYTRERDKNVNGNFHYEAEKGKEARLKLTVVTLSRFNTIMLLKTPQLL